MTTPTNHPLHRGIAALNAWLELHKLSVNRFAIQNGIDPSLLGKVMRGAVKRMSVDLANKIDRGTRGEVPVSVWVSDDAAEGDPKALVNILKEE